MHQDLDFGNRTQESRKIERFKSISFLIGAGFSAPMGYPIGTQVNERLQNFDENVDFAPDGSLCYNLNGTKPIFQIEGVLNNHQRYFIFCKKLIEEYSRNRKFDYEEFYDFIKSEEINQPKYKRLYNDSSELENFENYVFNLDHIYNQMVAHLLKDYEGKSWYDNEPFKLGYISGYDGFLRYLSKLKEESKVNIHTLNHDLLFESFNKTEYINGDISDGFLEIGSPYYGKLYHNDITVHCRLKYFANQYNTPIRLYKIHGSLNYVPFYNIDELGVMILDDYVKINYGIGYSQLIKENKENSKYEESPFAYHAYFLTGTTYKIRRYNEGIFNTLFESFKTNLQNADKLIIIGYGCKDLEVNNIIKENFDFINKPSFIIDPYADEDSQVYKFKDEINAILIKEELEYLSEEMFL